MLGREAGHEVFTDDHEEHAFELFSRLNKGGTSLSTGDVAGARLASQATRKIVEPMRAVVAEKEMRALGVNFVFLLRTLVTVHRHSCRFLNSRTVGLRIPARSKHRGGAPSKRCASRSSSSEMTSGGPPDAGCRRPWR
jgi:hypothetical protein